MLGKLVFCKSSTKSYTSKTELVLGIWNREYTEEDLRDGAEEKGEMPSLKHPARTGKKKSGAKKKKSWDSVVKGAQGKGVRNPKAYAAKIFRAQGIDPRTGKKTKKKK
jgi:hypothetical protein